MLLTDAGSNARLGFFLELVKLDLFGDLRESLLFSRYLRRLVHVDAGQNCCRSRAVVNHDDSLFAKVVNLCVI